MSAAEPDGDGARSTSMFSTPAPMTYVRPAAPATRRGGEGAVSGIAGLCPGQGFGCPNSARGEPHGRCRVSPVAGGDPRSYLRPMSAAIAIRRSRLARPRVSRAARIQIGIFLLGFLLFRAARFFPRGHLDQAKVNANWILDLEHHVGVDEGSIQDALTG